jgi:ABC-2 type transport system permease protein
MPERPEASARASEQFASDQLRVITAIAAIAGLCMSILGVVIGMIWSWGKGFYAPWWLFGVGLLLVIFFVFFNFEWLAKVITGRAALSGVLVAFSCVAAGAVWFGGNYFFNYPARNKLVKRFLKLDPLYAQADWTRMQRFKLDQKSAEVLNELDGKLEIKVLGKANPMFEGPELDDKLASYANASDKVELEFLVPGTSEYEFKRRELAKRLNKEDVAEIGWRSVALLYKDRFKYLSNDDLFEQRPVPTRFGQVDYQRIFKGEEAITSAITEMIDTEKTKVYFTVDHGERNPEDRGEQGTGLYVVGQLLKRSNIDWALMDLRTQKEIPQDATIVAICGPRREFTPEEIDVLEKYLDEGRGRLLITLDDYRPEVNLGLAPLLEHVGVMSGADYAVEKNDAYLAPHFPQVFIGRDLGYEPRAMMERLRKANIRPNFLGACTLRRIEGYRGQFSARDLCSGSADSYGETDLETLYKTRRTEYDKNSDTEGPVHYAMACWEGDAPAMGGRMDKKLGRVVVVGDTDWCTDQALRTFSDNRTFFMAVVNWLADKERRIQIEPKLAEDDSYTLKPIHEQLFKMVLIVSLVSLVLASALALWVRRR